jgi:hypothetical protein
MKKNVMLMFLAGLLILPAALSACRADVSDDIKLVQKDTPFNIIIPTYIPEVMGTNYFQQITGPFKDPALKDTYIKLRYIEEDYQIYVSEHDSNSVMMPTGQLDPVYYEIDGTRVLRQIARFHSTSTTIEGLGYYWNKEGLAFSVEIANIDEEEGLKIVESMIHQMDDLK